MQRSHRLRRILGVALVAALSVPLGVIAPPARAATEGDIVFIVDESGSMRPIQNQVKTNLASMTSQIDATGIDARYGLVGYGAGSFLGHSPNSGHTHTDLTNLATFQTALNELTDSGSIEPAFDAIVHAGGLSYRPSAKACVVLVTNEPSNGDLMTRTDALTSLQADNATFFGIHQRSSASDAQFDPLAAGTGGQNFSLSAFIDNPQAVLTALGQACAAAISGGISLSPTQAVNDVGTPHTVTATLVDSSNNPIAGSVVTFTIVSGPNAGAGGTCSVNVNCSSDATGKVSWTYTGAGGPGDDTIQGCFVDATGTNRCARATKTWRSLINASINDVTVTEGDTGTTAATFTVALSAAAPAAGVTVRATTANGTAVAPGDYQSQSNALVTVPSGQTSASFTVAVVGDLVNEPDETFVVDLSQPTNASITDGQGLGTILDDERDGAFSCRASGLRVGTLDPVVANRPNLPCADDASTLAQATLLAGLVNVVSNTVNARTDQTPNLLEPTPPSLSDNAVAVANVERAAVSALGLIGITANAVRSEARVRCVANPDGTMKPAFSSSSSIANLTVNGASISVLGNATIILPLGLGTVVVNRTVTTATSVTQQAISIKLLGIEIVIAEAKANFTGNPCSE